MNTPLKIILFVAITVALFLFFRKKTPANRAAIAMQRPVSFSFVIFEGDVINEIPRLLEGCQYKVLEKASAKMMLGDLYASLPEPSGLKNSIVSKAYARVGTYTVLCDPEMVFLTFIDELTKFCRVHLTQVFVAAWERVSETVALSQISVEGLTSQTFYVAGKAQGEQTQPHKSIQRNPNSDGLLQAMAELGVPLGNLKQEVEATVLKLQE